MKVYIVKSVSKKAGYEIVERVFAKLDDAIKYISLIEGALKDSHIDERFFVTWKEEEVF